MVEYKKSQGKAVELQSLGYILTLPDDIKENEKLPLIIFLHGAGERGDNLDLLTCYCIPKLFTKNPQHGGVRAITLSPQCPSECTWIDFKKELFSLFDEIIASYPVNEKKVSLCGISMGGFGTWELGLTNSWRFSALAPLCGGGMNWRAWYVKDVPIRVYHGRRDDIVPLCQSEAMVNSVKLQGGNVEFTIYDDLSHNCWDRAFEETDLINWLASQER